MTVRPIFGAIVPAMLLAGMVASATAQDGESGAGPAAQPGRPQAHAPLVINDDTIGQLRRRQVGSIILPEGKPPFAAVIVLHGCNGVSPNTRVWARRLASWGYAALIVDSFTARGLKQVCDGSRALPGYRRADDVFAAARYLRSRPDIDGTRIAALGYSHGGWTALNAAPEKRVAEAGLPPLRAIVALYPFCPLKVAPPLASDVAIFIGDADDWAKAGNCKTFVDKYAANASHRPSLVVYAGAYHSFDADRPARDYFGHHLAYDPTAAADAIERTHKFLDDRLRR
jgi:dienelactone hydrolase